VRVAEELNPIRAGLADKPEESDYTSIQERIREHAEGREMGREVDSTHVTPSLPADTIADLSGVPGGERMAGDSAVTAAPLLAFTGITDTGEPGLPYRFRDYLELVDWTGKAVRADKRGHIPTDLPPILGRLGMEPEHWVEMVRNYRHHFYGFVGSADVLARYGQAMGRSWLRGVGACRRLLGEVGSDDERSAGVTFS